VNVSYSDALRRAWHRMQAMLFRPFRLELWLVTGLSAFLARLLREQGSFAWNFRHPLRAAEPWSASGPALDGLRDRLADWLANPAILALIAAGLVIVAAVALVLAYVGARAEFVYLDNVVRSRGEFLAPWHRSGRLGRSLFLWRAGFSFAWLLPLAIVGVPLAGTVQALFSGGGLQVPSFLALLPAMVVAGAVALVLAFLLLVMDEFVVPVMWLNDESAMAAWGRFWPLFTSHLGDFVAYAFFVLVLALVAAMAVLVAGFATCCVGFAILFVPYVGTVAILPLHVTARALGPEFLAQYGPEWNVFAKPESPVTPVT